MLTASRSMNVFSANEAVATFAAPRVAYAPCGGMDNTNGKVAYSGGAPASAPLIEFSMNGSDWDVGQRAGLDASAAAGITAYVWSIQIESWLFMRLTVQPPVGSCRGAGRISPKLGAY